MIKQEFSKVEDQKDAPGLFPIYKMLKLSQADQTFDVILKNVRVRTARAVLAPAIAAAAEGEGILMITVGSKQWTIQLQSKDAELIEKKRIII